MVLVIIFLIPLFSLLKAQTTPLANGNLPSVILEEDNLDNTITQIFNKCKCVIFYLCDEQNFIIPPDELKVTKAPANYPLRRVNRLRCSNEFYYCCKNKTTVIELRHPQPSVPPKCGQGQNTSSSSRIIDEFPWMVAVAKKTDLSVLCDGVLIHPSVVLVGICASMFHPLNTLTVVSRRETLGKNTKQSNFSNISKIISYKNNDLLSYNDRALIILESPLRNVQPICLPIVNQNFIGKTCSTVRWSRTDHNGKMKLKKIHPALIVESQRCERSNNSSLWTSFLCVDEEEEEERAKKCQGLQRSVGILMCKDSDHFVQAGHAFWENLSCSHKKKPMIYSNVAYFVEWIKKNLMAENIPY